MVKRATWLSITPEPERELPEAVATLAAGRRADPGAVAAERERIERLVLRRGQRRWLTYLHGVVELIERRTQSVDPEVRRAGERARLVIANHHNLLLGLPGAGARLRRETDRARAGGAAPMTDAVDRARTFVQDVLMPLEQEAEHAGGRLPSETVAEIKRAAIAANLHGGRVARRVSAARGGRCASGSRSTSSSAGSPAVCTGTSPASTTCGRRGPTSSWSAGSARAGRRGRRRLRGHRGRGGLGPQPGSPPPRTRCRAAAGGSTARSGSSPPATSPASSS